MIKLLTIPTIDSTVNYKDDNNNKDYIFKQLDRKERKTFKQQYNNNNTNHIAINSVWSNRIHDNNINNNVWSDITPPTINPHNITIPLNQLKLHNIFKTPIPSTKLHRHNQFKPLLVQNLAIPNPLLQENQFLPLQYTKNKIHKIIPNTKFTNTITINTTNNTQYNHDNIEIKHNLSSDNLHNSVIVDNINSDKPVVDECDNIIEEDSDIEQLDDSALLREAKLINEQAKQFSHNATNSISKIAQDQQQNLTILQDSDTTSQASNTPLPSVSFNNNPVRRLKSVANIRSKSRPKDKLQQIKTEESVTIEYLIKNIDKKLSQIKTNNSVATDAAVNSYVEQCMNDIVSNRTAGLAIINTVTTNTNSSNSNQTLLNLNNKPSNNVTTVSGQIINQSLPLVISNSNCNNNLYGSVIDEFDGLNADIAVLENKMQSAIVEFIPNSNPHTSQIIINTPNSTNIENNHSTARQLVDQFHEELSLNSKPIPSYSISENKEQFEFIDSTFKPRSLIHLAKQEEKFNNLSDLRKIKQSESSSLLNSSVISSEQALLDAERIMEQFRQQLKFI